MWFGNLFHSLGADARKDFSPYIAGTSGVEQTLNDTFLYYSIAMATIKGDRSGDCVRQLFWKWVNCN